jgi:hypothetical protein
MHTTQKSQFNKYYKYKALQVHRLLTFTTPSTISHRYTNSQNQEQIHKVLPPYLSNKSVVYNMGSISRYPHPWPMYFISSLSPYELEDAYNDILDTLDCIDLGFYGFSRMLETAVRIYQYSLSHGSIFRVHHTMTTLIERPSTPINIVKQAPAAPNVIVQQQQPQQIVIQQAAAPMPQVVYVQAPGQQAAAQPGAPMITPSATQVARKGEIESLKREKEKMEQEAEIRKQRREVEELRERIARDEAREREEREQELQRQRETRRERRDERQNTRREERQETRRDDRRDERQETRRSEQQDTRRDDLKFPQRSDPQPTRRADPNAQTTPASSRPTPTARDETRENRPKVNLYWSLGLDENTHPSSTEIKEAYKALSLKHHPDRNPSEHSAQRMREINQAKAILIDDEERKRAYDEEGIIKEHHFLEWKKRRGGRGEV